MNAYTPRWLQLALLSLGLYVLSTAHVFAITCPGTDGVTACEIASGTSFVDVMQGIAIVAAALVTLGLFAYGARIIINWTKGRRTV